MKTLSVLLTNILNYNIIIYEVRIWKNMVSYIK